MKLIVILLLMNQLLCQCVFNDQFVRSILESEDFAPVGAGQNEVFYSQKQVYKEIRMPKNVLENKKKTLEFQQELQALIEFQNEFYVAGIDNSVNFCTFTYIAADIINLDEEYENFTPFQAQKWEDFYYYSSRLVRHRFMNTLSNSKTPHFREIYKRLKKDKNFYLTYFIRMKKAEQDLFDILQDPQTQNWGWRLDISLQIIRYLRYFKRPRINKQDNTQSQWHHLDMKPENILMQDFYTPLISDLGNATNDKVIFQGSLKGTTAFLDPSIITLELFFQPQNFNELQQKQQEIEQRYQRADEYALGATLLRILLPHVYLDYDAELQSSNINQVLESLQSDVELTIMGFLRNLLTDHYQLRANMKEAENLFMELIFYIKQQFGDTMQLVEYLENQLDFYMQKQYQTLKKAFWKEYIKKIKKYQKYYSMLNDDSQRDINLENFFDRFNKITNTKKGYIMKNQQQTQKKNDKNQFRRMETTDFFQTDNNFERSRTIAGNREELLQNGLHRQSEVVGNAISVQDTVLRRIKTRNFQVKKGKKRAQTQDETRSTRKNKKRIVI